MRRSIWAIVAVTATATTALLPAQRDRDLRDVDTLKSGREVRGRVAREFDAEDVLIMQGGKRVRVDHRKIKSMDTVRSRVNTFLDQRARCKADPKRHWTLARWAIEHELTDMARLQALTVVELDDDHEAAHELLGHRHSKSEWRWKVGSRSVSKAKFDEYHADIGHPLELQSAHFRIRTDAGRQRAVDTLIDLERLYRYWFQTWGEELGLAEAIQRMDIQIWSDEDKFPGWIGTRLGYFEPHPHSDLTYTYFPSGSNTTDRPQGLFSLGTQHLLYRCLAGSVNPSSPQARLCDWVEIGLGEWIQNCATGPFGAVEFGDHSSPQAELDLVLAGQQRSSGARQLELTNLLHWTLRDHFYGTAFNRRTDRPQARAGYWATAHLFVTMLMDPKVDKDNPERLMNYIRMALGEGKGDSSSTFDDAMGKPIEKFEDVFAEWLRG